MTRLWACLCAHQPSVLLIRPEIIRVLPFSGRSSGKTLTRKHENRQSVKKTVNKAPTRSFQSEIQGFAAFSRPAILRQLQSDHSEKQITAACWPAEGKRPGWYLVCRNKGAGLVSGLQKKSTGLVSNRDAKNRPVSGQDANPDKKR